jgi:hypothetical protein
MKRPSSKILSSTDTAGRPNFITAGVAGRVMATIPVESASTLIDEGIKELGDWRGKALARVREIIHEADPEIVEEWKWRGLPSGLTAALSARERVPLRSCAVRVW